MRNTYKYTQLYSGKNPTFIEEADVFRTIVPLAAIATGRVGPHDGMTHQDTHQDEFSIKKEKILSFCITPQSRSAIAEHCGYKDRVNFSKRYLKPLIESGLLLMTIPDKPNSKHQKYVTVQFGEAK